MYYTQRLNWPTDQSLDSSTEMDEKISLDSSQVFTTTYERELISHPEIGLGGWPSDKT